MDLFIKTKIEIDTERLLDEQIFEADLEDRFGTVFDFSDLSDESKLTFLKEMKKALDDRIKKLEEKAYTHLTFKEN